MNTLWKSCKSKKRNFFQPELLMYHNSVSQLMYYEKIIKPNLRLLLKLKDNLFNVFSGFWKRDSVFHTCFISLRTGFSFKRKWIFVSFRHLQRQLNSRKWITLILFKQKQRLTCEKFRATAKFTMLVDFWHSRNDKRKYLQLLRENQWDGIFPGKVWKGDP